MTDYLTVSEILEIHTDLMEAEGGMGGVRDLGALESAVFRPQSGYYTDLIQESAALMESLAMNHPFIDGNKRVSFFATDTFLRMNGFVIEADNEEAYQWLMALFERQAFDIQNLEPWLRAVTKPL